jgi:hypothetical protein
MHYADGSTSLALGVWDLHENYSRTTNSVLGVIQILCGLLSMALGVGAICTWASGYYIAYGIWCGFMFTVTGGICIGAARHQNACLILTNLVLSIICVCLGFIQMSLGIVAAAHDAPGNRADIVSGVYAANYLDWDIYYTQNNPLVYLCAGQNTGINWKGSWGPVDILLLITGFIEAVFAIVAAVLCSLAVCCGPRRITGAPGMYYQGGVGTGTTGFTNEGYMTDPRLSPSPPLYKVM